MIMNPEPKMKGYNRMEILVDEVMREEFALIRSLHSNSPESESSSDKDSLTATLDYHPDTMANTPAKKILVSQDRVLVRQPLHIGGKFSIVFDSDFKHVKTVPNEVTGNRLPQFNVAVCEKLLLANKQSANLVCEVCSARAGKHSYYGGQVCPSCRAFFRRSVQAGYNEKLKCKRGRGRCEVTLITRKNCQSCRYQRCIAAGMRPSWILSDEERERRFHGQDRGKGHKAEKHGSDLIQHIVHNQPVSRKTKIPIIPIQDPDPNKSLTAEDRLQILQYGEVMKSCCARRHDDLDPQMVTELLQIALHGSSLSHQTAAQLHTVVENRTSQCFYLLQEFQALPPPDQDQIVQNNLQMIHRFRQALWWGNTKYHSRWLVGLFMGEDKCLEIENIPQDFSIKCSSAKPFEYQSLFTSPWCQSEEVEVLHKNLMKDISESVDSDDEIEIILIVLIIAFSADFLDLKDRNQVEKMQLKFVLLLQAHFSAIYPEKEVAGRLAKALMIPALARQILQITGRRLAL